MMNKNGRRTSSVTTPTPQNETKKIIIRFIPSRTLTHRPLLARPFIIAPIH